MAIPGIKNLSQKPATNAKNLNAAPTAKPNTGKFNALLDDAKKDEDLKEARQKALESQAFVSMNATDPSSHPIEVNKDE